MCNRQGVLLFSAIGHLSKMSPHAHWRDMCPARRALFASYAIETETEYYAKMMICLHGKVRVYKFRLGMTFNYHILWVRVND